MNWLTKFRPQVLAGMIILGALAWKFSTVESSWTGEAVIACVTGIAICLPKLIDDKDGDIA